MGRKEIARRTVNIQTQGFYEYNGTQIDIAQMQKQSEEASFLLTPKDGEKLLAQLELTQSGKYAVCEVTNESSVGAVFKMAQYGKKPAVLNFASAKNPGGGFLNGAVAQEEALAASSGLYHTLLRHPAYYDANRQCGTMVYTNHAIYSPHVVFFRDEKFELAEAPVTASVLTLPAVNMGQVLLKGEDVQHAKEAMKARMRLCLAIFAKQREMHLILGAYGCGVFRNDANEVARWWRELLDEGFGYCFEEIRFAVLDRSGKNFAAFQNYF